MKRTVLLFGLFFLPLALLAQEEDELSLRGPADFNQNDFSLLDFNQQQSSLGFYDFGQFTIPHIQGFSFVKKNQKLNMLALGRKMGFGQQAQPHIPDYEFAERLNLSIHIYRNAKNNFEFRTQGYPGIHTKRTPDGGIRNEVYEGVEQPFINPYYGRRTFYRPYGRQGRSGFYFYRR